MAGGLVNSYSSSDPNQMSHAQAISHSPSGGGFAVPSRTVPITDEDFAGILNGDDADVMADAEVKADVLPPVIPVTDFVLVDIGDGSADALKEAERSPNIAGNVGLYRCVDPQLWAEFTAARAMLETLRWRVLTSPKPTFAVVPDTESGT